MQLAVLASPDSWHLADLVRAASGHALTPINFRQLLSSIEAGSADYRASATNLKKFDAVLVRGMPAGSLEQIVFRMDVLGELARSGTTVLNAPRALEVAVDKYLASARLAAAGLLTPRTIACQTVEDAQQAFADLGGDVVVKPLFGAEGRGIARLQDESLAQRAFKMLVGMGAVIYLQTFIPHEGFDLRLLVIGEQVFGIRRRSSTDWRTNISRGAIAESFAPSAELQTMARTAAAAVGAEIAGVDLLPGRDGQIYAIEVNAVPGWKALSSALGIDVARLVIEHIAAKIK